MPAMTTTTTTTTTTTLSVTEALQSRLSIRDFLPKPVPLAVIRRVLATASRAPSGGNLQPCTSTW